MNLIPQPDSEGEPRVSSGLLDVLIRAGLISALAVLCYQVFSPFLSLMAWSIILAITMYPLHQWLARRVGGKQWLASTILVIIGLLLIIIPTGLLMNSFADSVRHFIAAVENNTLAIPAPPERAERWPIIGKRVYHTWSKAHADHLDSCRAYSRRSANWPRKHLPWSQASAATCCCSRLIHHRRHSIGVW